MNTISLGSGLWKGLLTLLGLALVGVMLTAWPSLAAGSAGNQAQQQIILDYPVTAVQTAAPRAFEQWDRGELVTVEKGADATQVKGLSRTRFFKFVDDISVEIQSEDETHTRVTVESVGRVGEYDFGGNQRNIDEYLAALQALLAQPDPIS